MNLSLIITYVFDYHVFKLKCLIFANKSIKSNFKKRTMHYFNTSDPNIVAEHYTLMRRS